VWSKLIPSNQIKRVANNSNKSKQQEIKGRSRTQEFFYLVWSNDDLVWGREQLFVPL